MTEQDLTPKPEKPTLDQLREITAKMLNERELQAENIRAEIRILKRTLKEYDKTKEK